MREVLESLNGAAGMTFVAVLNSLWQALVIAAAVWVALKCVPRMNGATRYGVWWVVLAVVMVLPMAPRIVVDGKPALAAAEPTALLLPAAPSTARPMAAMADAPPSERGLAPLKLRAGAWLAGLLAIWTIVFLFRLWQVLRSYRYLCGLKQRALAATRPQRENFDAWLMACRINRPVRLLVSNEINSPMAVGFLQPAVILPEQLINKLDEEELDHVLLHELAHIARRDDWSNLAAQLAAAALALHPVAAWVLKRIEREREIACDDWVVSATGEARPYAASLARLFELCWTRRREPLAAGMADHASLLGERIEVLLRRGRESGPHISLARVTLSAVILLALVVAGAQTPRWIAFAQEPDSPQPPDAPAASSEPAEPSADRQRPRRPNAFLQARASSQAATTQRPASPAAAATAESKGSLLAALAAAGYGSLSVDEIIEIKNNGVNAEFINGINQAGWGKLTPKQLVELRVHGVTPDYVRRAREAGLKDLQLEDVVQLRVHGVRADHLQEIHALGFGPYTTRQAIDLAVNGVHVEFFRALKDAGFAGANHRDIIDARVNGLRGEDLQEAKKYNSNLTLKQMIRLKHAGVI